MRTLLTALTCLMLFTTSVVAGDFEDAVAAWAVGNYAKSFPVFKRFAEEGNADA